MAFQVFASGLSKMINRGIEIFGDSIMKGIMLDDAGRYYVAQGSAASELMEEFPGMIVNRAKFGCTIGKGLVQVERFLKNAKEGSCVLLEFGGNDCDFDWNKVAASPKEEHLPNTPLPVFIETYEKMISLIREKGIEPVIMNLPPIDAHRYLDWITRLGADRDSIMEFLGDELRIYRYQELYSQTVTNLAAKMQVRCVDVRSAFLYNDNYGRLMCEDGIHPNENGQRLIKDVLMKTCTA